MLYSTHVNGSSKISTKQSRTGYWKISLLAMMLAMLPYGLYAQTSRTITGTVIDASDELPMPGVHVQDKAGTALSTTDIDGKYSITVTGANPVLVFTFMGYDTQEIPVGANKTIDVVLQEGAQALEEVVVAGGGTQKKVSITGAITSIKGDALVAPTSNLTQSFAGRIAGVVARQTSGEPGSGAEFYIRGIGTFGGRTTPLILLDDVEISAADLNYVPAENIESFSILKDASATAIYGARGANGVMMITTKSGDYNAKTQLNITVENSFNFLDKFPEFVDGATYMEMFNEAARARGKDIRFTQEQIDNTRAGIDPIRYPDVNWTDILFKSMAMRQKANMNVSGGGSKVKYFMSLEVNHDAGLLNSEKLYSWNNQINIMNYTFQNNIAYKLTPTTTIRMNMNAQIRQNRGPNVGTTQLFNYALTCPPTLFPVTYPDREGPEYAHVLYGNNYVTGTAMYTNPYAVLNTSFAETNQSTLNTVIKIDQDFDFITKGLKLNGWVNLKSWASSSFNRSINPYYYRAVDFDPANPSIYDLELLNTNGTDFIAESSIARNTDRTFELQLNLNWNRNFGNHNVGAMLLYKQREYRSDVLPNRNQGLSGRIMYDYNNRYLFEANFGYNGTERLAKKDRFGFFPAASVGWVISNEAFFEPVRNTITHLKVRGSYGLVGSDDLAAADAATYFLYLDRLQNGSLNSIGWTFGESMNYNLGGPELIFYGLNGIGWEKVKKLDVGLDIVLFRDLNITADYFLDKRYDIFMKREAWPQSLAYDAAKPYGNVGKMDNSGFEVSVNYSRRLNQDWSVSAQGNFTYTENKVVYKDEPLYPTVWKMEINKPLNPIFGYVCDGMFTSEEEIESGPKHDLGSTVRVGDLKYRDISGDGRVDATDQMMISPFNGTPRVQYGFGATMQWKKLDFGIFFVGSARRVIMTNGKDPFQDAGNGGRGIIKYIADDYWSAEEGNAMYQNWDAKYPRLGLVATDISNNTANSTYWLRDGSFLRLKNIELGYSIPHGRIYVSAANLYTFSKFKLWDPELAGWNSYPMQRTVNVGLQLTF